MHFTNPLALLLFLSIPFFVWLGWPMYAPQGRGFNRKREWVSLILRLILVTGLILGLAGLQLPNQNSPSLGVVFLVDVSDSMPLASQAAALDFIRQALAGMGADDQAAVILFAAEALVERPMLPDRELRAFASTPITSQTDLAKAIRLGMALYPSGMARRMVILSDGVYTRGDAWSAARLARTASVEILALPLNYPEPGPEVLVSDLEVPQRLRQGDRFDLNLTLQASQPAQVEVIISSGTASSGQEVLYAQTMEVPRGVQTFNLPLTAGEPGFTHYEVVIHSLQDHYTQNNRMSAYTQILGPPQVLIVAPTSGDLVMGEPRPDEVTALKSALGGPTEAGGYIVQLTAPVNLPSELNLLAAYAAIILVDVPARQLNDYQMTALQSYVRDLAGGLVTIGGPTSYGVGGYFRTPLEEILPLDMQIKDELRRPSLTMIFIIDHSGSMSEASGGATKLELAKEAAIRSVELLQPGDRVGVIAFDESASWVVPVTSLEDIALVQRAIATIRSGGGTDILAGLQAMASVLPEDPAANKHVILLTDGGANPSGIPELVQQLNQDYGITLTTVGVGRDAAPFLPQIAELGAGRYHFADRPSAIPTIFTEETSLATRAYIIEEAFIPTQYAQSPILSGIQNLPPLLGYVGTSLKPGAQLILGHPQGDASEPDPILAAWQYGLGKVVSFTSDATGRWAKEWVPWSAFATFWAQAVRYAIDDAMQASAMQASAIQAAALDIQVLQVSGTEDNEEAILNVEASLETSAGITAFLNGYQMQANIVNPNGASSQVTLRQIAPGRYQGRFYPGFEAAAGSRQGQGVYMIYVSGNPPGDDPSNPAMPPVAATTGWVLSYSPEYRILEAGPAVVPNGHTLDRLAAAQLVKLIDLNTPRVVFSEPPIAPRTTQPVWPWLLALAALLLPIDIAVRRLVIGRSDWHRLGAAAKHAIQQNPIFGRKIAHGESAGATQTLAERRCTQRRVPQLESTIPRLRQAKARRHGLAASPVEDTTTPGVLNDSDQGRLSSPWDASPGRTTPETGDPTYYGPESGPAPAVQAPAVQAPPGHTSDTIENLLAKKRSRGNP